VPGARIELATFGYLRKNRCFSWPPKLFWQFRISQNRICRLPYESDALTC